MDFKKNSIKMSKQIQRLIMRKLLKYFITNDFLEKNVPYFKIDVTVCTSMHCICKKCLKNIFLTVSVQLRIFITFNLKQMSKLRQPS